MTLTKAKNTILVTFAAVALGVTFQAVAAAPASADSCTPHPGEYWECIYGNESVPRYTKRWFQAEVTLRNWKSNSVFDYYGGSVYKCAGYKWNGFVIPIACGTSNNVGAPIEASIRPGWVYIEQQANGPRLIWGNAHQVYPV